MNTKTLIDRINKALKRSNDNYVTKVLEQCLTHLGEPLTIPAPLGMYDMVTPLTFGKYKDKTLEELIEEDVYYLNWLKENNVVDLTNDARGKIKKVMKTQYNRNRRHFNRGLRGLCDWSHGSDWTDVY
jgi:uncharacterized protein (DUF3820 family)